jgi:hypothetical protein
LGRLQLDKISGEVVARLFARLRTNPPGKKTLAEKTIKNVRATLTIAMTLRYAHVSPGAGADWIRMLEAPAHPRHSDGSSRIANQKVPVTFVS